ncbi:hypothetical protein GX51_02501 [Blastomyces parvus]|uniref:Uncharacterized protein n=1 Tax=Blastomyces parvus TaxID=2060905 RepID=A0A2B7X3S6_9EURO|nr:hypothetical protein GX51_02501 [Blastomyces parvus]
MGVLSSLCQLTLLFKMASAQIAKPPLMKNSDDLDPEFDAVLPAPQNYMYTRWSEVDIKACGIPTVRAWVESLYEKGHVHYCKNDFSIYNVTFTDCSEPWVVGRCALASKSREETFNLFARLPSSARGGISDLLHARFYPDMSYHSSQGNSAVFAGYFRPADGLKMLLRALHRGVPGIPIDEFEKAIEADSCVADEAASKALEDAIERGFAIAAYLKLVKTPPIDASCMSNQLKIFRAILDRQ